MPFHEILLTFRAGSTPASTKKETLDNAQDVVLAGSKNSFFMVGDYAAVEEIKVPVVVALASKIESKQPATLASV